MSQTQWKYLEPHPQSFYKQLYVKGTRTRAEIIHNLDERRRGSGMLRAAPVRERGQRPTP
jgi:hypothetical protein